VLIAVIYEPLGKYIESQIFPNSTDTSIWSNIIALISIGLFIFLIIKVYYFLTRDSLADLLSLDRSKKIVISYGNVQVKNSDPTPVLSKNDLIGFDYGDTEALVKVYSKARALFKWIEPKLVCNNIDKSDISANIISVGGPRWNKVTERLIGEIGSPLFYEQGKDGLVEKRNGLKTDLLQYTKKSTEIEDYGCWIIEKKDENKGGRLIVSGYTTAGVLIAAEALSELNKSDYKYLRETFKKEGKCAVIFKGKIEIGSDGRYKSISKPQLVKERLIHVESFYAKHENYSYENGVK
jgi:hypothetical protein